MNYQLLIYLDAVQPPITHNLNLATYLIGRNPGCNVLIIDKYVSRHHCTLVLMPPDKTNPIPYYSIIDGALMAGTKSTSGTWINGLRANSAQLKHQDVITFGSREYPKAVFIADILDTKEDGTFSNYTQAE